MMVGYGGMAANPASMGGAPAYGGPSLHTGLVAVAANRGFGNWGCVLGHGAVFHCSGCSGDLSYFFSGTGTSSHFFLRKKLIFTPEHWNTRNIRAGRHGFHGFYAQSMHPGSRPTKNHCSKRSDCSSQDHQSLHPRTLVSAFCWNTSWEGVEHRNNRAWPGRRTAGRRSGRRYRAPPRLLRK